MAKNKKSSLFSSSSEDENTEHTSVEETSDEATPSTNSSSSTESTTSQAQKQATVSSSGGGQVTLVNRTNRNIELDFGRDKEVRIPAQGKAQMPKAYLEHPKFLNEKKNLTVVGG